MGKKSRHLTDKDIEVIIELLDGWDGSLTWEALCAACVKAIGFKPTRQTLHNFSRVAGAYRLAKEREKNDVKDLKIPATLAVAAQRIERLTREVERLERENVALLEQFVVWQYNAYTHGISREKLNKGLLQIDRGQTD